MSIKKRIKPGRIEPSSDGSAIVVHFTTEITHLDEDGMPGRVEKAPDKREVPVAKAIRGLRVEDIPALAQEIVEKCRYIPATKTRQVEQVLTKLHSAQPPSLTEGRDHGSPPQGSTRSSRGGARDSIGGGDGRSTPNSVTPSTLMARPADLLPEASVDRIDDYADELYEEQMEMKAVGAQRLLRICTEVRNLVEISEHSTLLGVLSRELRENAKRSHELAVAITGIFLCLAHFSQFHGILIQNQCNDVTMRVVEYESRRRNVLQKELKLSQGQMVARGSQVSVEERDKLDREERRYRGVMDRQDRLLQLCLLVLRDLSEDPSIEQKLVAQRLTHFLLPLLGRSSEDLLISTMGFLHKLSAFEQNKDQMVQNADALVRLAELVGHPSVEVSLLALRLCFNLSFDVRGRTALATQTSLLGKLLVAVQQSSIRKVALRVLYHLSMEGSVRTMIANKHAGIVNFALQLVARSKEPAVDAETAALCINLAADEACAAIMAEAEVFPRVARRAVQNGDPLLLKIVRHIISHQSLRHRVLAVLEGDSSDDSISWLHEVVRLAAAAVERPEVLVEALGILAGLDCESPEVPWPELCEEGLLDLLHRLLMVGFSPDDVVLECIMISSILALDPDSVILLASSKVPSVLPELLLEKQEDVEIIVQLLFAFRCLLLQEETCEVVLTETEAPERILDLLRECGGMDARAQAIQAAGEEVLDLILALEGQLGQEPRWVERIKEFRFELHNEEWCQRLRRGDRHQEAGEQKLSHETARGSQVSTDIGNLADRCWGGGSSAGKALR